MIVLLLNLFLSLEQFAEYLHWVQFVLALTKLSSFPSLEGQLEGQQLLELNAVCSMPQSPGWPAYDNLYGRAIQRGEEAKGTTGTTSWQVLFHFDGRQEARMGSSPGPWLARLRDNLCRRGDFDDRPGKR